MLKIEQLNVKYGHIHAVKGISLEVKAGESVALLGANGAGKTSTIRAISGILKLYRGWISQGSIYFKGELLNNLSTHEIMKRGITCIPEGRELFAKLTVFENLIMGGFTINDKKIIRNQLDEVFEIFPILAERKNQIANTLSGGEQQMLAIGRGLMSNPNLILLDEPSLGLAPILVEKVFDVCRKLVEKGIIFLLIEQNANVALDFVDRAYIIETGIIKLEGNSKKLKNDPNVKKVYLGGDVE